MEYYVEDNIEQLIPSVVKKYWCYDLNKEKPSEVSIFDEKKYYWRNSAGILFHRSPLKIDEPLSQTSQIESAFFCLVSQFFLDAIQGSQIDGNEMDIYIPSIKLAIEYDGSYYHKNKLKKDLQKNVNLNNLGIYVIRIREQGCPLLVDENNAIINFDYDAPDLTVEQIFVAINNHICKNNIKVSKSNIQKVKNLSSFEYKLSRETAKKRCFLRADDPDRYLKPQERIKNYCRLHRDNIFDQIVWKKFLLLLDNAWYRVSIDGTRLFKDLTIEGIDYEKLSRENRCPLLDFVIVGDVECLKNKYKSLINNGYNDWLEETLNVIYMIYKDATLSSEDIVKMELLLEIIDCFKRNFPNDYRIPRIINTEKNFKKKLLSPSPERSSSICDLSSAKTRRAFANQWERSIENYYALDGCTYHTAKWYINNIFVPRISIDEGIVKAVVTDQANINYNVLVRIDTYTEKYLLPMKDEISFECNCKDKERPCKHILAVLYTLSDKEKRGFKVFESLL